MSRPADMAMNAEMALAVPAGRENLLVFLALATFVVSFQAYAVAPMFLDLAAHFNAQVRDVGLAVPAYLMPYRIATLGA